MAPQAKKNLRYSLDGAVSNPLPQGTPVQPQGDLVMVGGRSGFGTPPPLFFPSPKNWLFCMSGLIQTRGIFSRAPLSPCEHLKRSRDGGKKSAGKKFIFPNLGTGTGFRNRPGSGTFQEIFFPPSLRQNCLAKVGEEMKIYLSEPEFFGEIDALHKNPVRSMKKIVFFFLSTIGSFPHHRGHFYKPKMKDAQEK